MSALQAMLDDLETPLKPVPRFTIEPRDKGSASEIERQTSFLALMKVVAPSALIWAVPNGHNRGFKDRVKAKKEGLRGGVPDLTVCWNHGTAFLEFKNGTDKPSDNQTDLLNYLEDAGHRCAVVRTPEFALELLAGWGVPVIARNGL